MTQVINLDADFLSPRRCMRDPIPEIFEAAELLSEAADRHLVGDELEARRLLKRADMSTVRMWTDSLWGARKNHPDQGTYHRYRPIELAPPRLPIGERVAMRMPTAAQKISVVETFKKHCAFCRIPLIHPEIRKLFHRWYPDEVPWGDATHEQHAAFQCLWMQFDHLLPHSRGGDNSLENLVLTCAGCNFGRMQWTLEEVGLLDPRGRSSPLSDWDGLERVRGMFGPARLTSRS